MTLVDQLIARTEAAFAARPRPESTYRLQFHKGFTFRDAAAITEYLHQLGVTHAYASPYLQAAPGSTHGYDVINHNRLNPELGSDADYDAWLKTLADAGMSHILDTVPNHAGVATNENPWWNDVLMHGPASRYADYFDIAWDGSPRQELHGKILLPLLGGMYGKVLESGELKLTYQEGRFFLNYYARRFPINPSSLVQLLRHDLPTTEAALGCGTSACTEFQAVLAALAQLPPPARCDRKTRLQRHEQTEAIEKRLAALVNQNPNVGTRIDALLTRFNGTPGEPASFDLLDALLNQQSYRLAYWHVASDEINYRRFFDINDLAALKMENLEVFEAAHKFTFQRLAEGKIAGLRIDHPDGLLDPAEYFQRLQFYNFLSQARHIAGTDPAFQNIPWQELEPAIAETLRARCADRSQELPLYVTVEKILATEEQLPPTWAVDGTSGYDFLIHLNGLFINPDAEKPLSDTYHQFINNHTPFPDLVYAAKRLILDIALASELQMLTHLADALAQKDRHSRDFTLRGLHDGLRELIACFPVYRSYITAAGPSTLDRQYIDAAVEAAMGRNPKTDRAVFDFLRSLILQESPAAFTESDRRAQQLFAGKFQQLTAPVTAKGIEDTAFYRFNRLVSLNEVGGDPDHFGTSPDALHAYFADRQKRWPYALSPLSTHDTKRSEDVRARLHALSELSTEWGAHLPQWHAAAADIFHQRPAGPAPASNDEYLLYQILLGAWPFSQERPDDAFVTRIQAYMVKAMREAKVHTSWTNPDAAYEEGVKAFAADLIRGDAGAPFRRQFLPFQRRLSDIGIWNSLAQTLIRLTAPGAPDTYQGTELWDLSLVDPDNRRPVDYPLRQKLLTTLQAAETSNPSSLLHDLLHTREDGRIKLFTTWKALATRRSHPGLFSTGDYLPLRANGPAANNLFAFARTHGAAAAITIAPRLIGKWITPEASAPTVDRWKNTTLSLPPTFAGKSFRNALTGETLNVPADGALAVGDILKELPLALLITA